MLQGLTSRYPYINRVYSNMKVLVLGGSRNIGYFAAQRCLQNGGTVTFLLRNKSCFDKDESITPFVTSGKARLVQGDALKEEDVKRAFEAASEGDGGPLDIVLFTVGGTAKMSLTKGAIITPPDLCTHSMLNLLAAYPRGEAASQPKLVIVSSTGLGATAYKALPLPLKAFHSYVLDRPHADKLGMERVVQYCAGWEWPAADGEPEKDILPDGWQDSLGPSGWLKHVVIVRPALLTDGECKGDVLAPASAPPPYRAENKELKGSYTISRKDVAHFMVTRVLANWPEWEGQCVRIAY